MITVSLKSQVNRVLHAFWSGGIANRLTLIEQITYLLFAKRLDELHAFQAKKTNRLGQSIEDPSLNADQQLLRWSHFLARGGRWAKRCYTAQSARVFFGGLSSAR